MFLFIIPSHPSLSILHDKQIYISIMNITPSSLYRLDECGKLLYKTRWKGYTAHDDTWEPIANVASTGHVDRYERLQRQKSLLHHHEDSACGVAIIEYDDGEREMVDMTIETFRPYRGSDDEDEDDNDDDDNVGANGRGGRKKGRKKMIQVVAEKEDPTMINDYAVLSPGNDIEILWKHANMYFPCKVISWTSLSPRRASGRTTASSSFKNDNDCVGVGVAVGRSVSHNNKEQTKVGGRSTRRSLLNDTVNEEIKVDMPKQQQQQQQQL